MSQYTATYINIEEYLLYTADGIWKNTDKTGSSTLLQSTHRAGVWLLINYTLSHKLATESELNYHNVSIIITKQLTQWYSFIVT